jgi:RNA-binding protein 8A
VEGWVIFVSGIRSECRDDDLRDRFCDFGRISHISSNLGRITGASKGYELIEYSTKEEAEAAILKANQTKFIGSNITVAWCFIKSSKADTLPGKRLLIDE